MITGGLTTGDWAFILIVTVIALVGVVCYFGGHMAYKDGWEAGRQYEQGRQNERRLRDAARIRAARTVPRPAPPWYTVVTASRVTYGGISGPSTIPIPHRHAPSRPVTLTRTGEFRSAAIAGTDLYIDQMRASEENYRHTLRQEISA